MHPTVVSNQNTPHVSSYSTTIPSRRFNDGIRMSLKNLESLGFVALIQLPWIGIACIENIIRIIPPKYYKDYLEVSSTTWNYIWFIYPIVSFFVPPIVGTMSDMSYFSSGKRRPIIFTNLILVIGFGILWAICPKWDLSALSVVSYCGFLIGFTSLKFPFQALTVDLTTMNDQMILQIMGCIYQSLGSALGNFLLKDCLLLLNSQQRDDFSWKFGIALGILCITLLWSCCSISEKKPRYIEDESPLWKRSNCITRFENIVSQACKRCWDTPERIRWVCLVLVFASCSFLFQQKYSLNWWGKTIYNGCNDLNSPDCSLDGMTKYDKGVRMYVFGSMLLNAVQCLHSILLFVVMTKFSFRIAFTISLFIPAPLVLVAGYGTGSNVAIGMAFTSLLGVARASTFILPFYVVGVVVKYQSSIGSNNCTALYFAVLNMFVVTNWLVNETYGYMIASSYGPQHTFPLSSLFLVIAAIVAWFYKYPSIDV